MSQRKCLALLPSFRRRGTSITSGRGSPQLASGEKREVDLRIFTRWEPGGSVAPQGCRPRRGSPAHVRTPPGPQVSAANMRSGSRVCSVTYITFAESTLSCARRSLSITMFRSRNSIGSWTNAELISSLSQAPQSLLQNLPSKFLQVREALRMQHLCCVLAASCASTAAQ